MPSLAQLGAVSKQAPPQLHRTDSVHSTDRSRAADMYLVASMLAAGAKRHPCTTSRSHNAAGLHDLE